MVYWFLQFHDESCTGGLRVEWSPATRSIRVRVPASATFFFRSSFFFFFLIFLFLCFSSRLVEAVRTFTSILFPITSNSFQFALRPPNHQNGAWSSQPSPKLPSDSSITPLPPSSSFFKDYNSLLLFIFLTIKILDRGIPYSSFLPSLSRFFNLGSFFVLFL